MTVTGEALFALLRLEGSLESNCNNNTDIYIHYLIVRNGVIFFN